MPYSPEDIVAYEFRPKTRGYDKDEVDGFLDALADQIEEAGKEHEAVRAQLTALQAELAEARQSESALKRAFITVQEASDRALAEAQEEVARLREEVAKELEELRERASREAMATQLRAEDEAREMVESAKREVAEQRQRVDELQRIDAEHRQLLEAHLQEQLAALQALPDPFAALAAELSPPPAPQTSEGAADVGHGSTGQHADEQRWGDGGPDEATAEDGGDATAPDPGGAAGDPGDAAGDEPQEHGPAGDADTDAEHAASLEEEVADLWRLQEHGDHGGGDHGGAPAGDEWAGDGGGDQAHHDEPSHEER